MVSRNELPKSRVSRMDIGGNNINAYVPESPREGYTIVPGPFGFGDMTHLQAKRDGVSYSNLLYRPEGDGFYITVTSEIRGQGAAAALIRNFADRVGPHVPIHGEVGHEETLEQLFDAGLGRRARAEGEVVIDDPKFVHRLPIVRVTLAGGIPFDKLRITYSPDDSRNPFRFYIYGTTDPERAALIRERLRAEE